MYATESGKKIDLSNAKEIAAGGEGRILEHPKKKDTVIKIYHTLRPKSFAAHLKLLSTLNDSFVKPQEIYFNESGTKVAGFEMDYVNFNDYWLFNNFFNKGFCTSNNITDAFKIKVLKKLSSCIHDVHTKKIVIGDLNQYNLFVSKKGDILFVDVDSYASDISKHNGVLLDDIRDWTTNLIDDKTDNWAFDILSFWTVTFCHPFKWVIPGNNETLPQRVKAGKSILSKLPGIIIPPLYVAPSGDLLTQFKDIFGGRRYKVDFEKAPVPVNIVIKKAVDSASLTIREITTNIAQVNACTNTIAIREINSDKWILLETVIHGLTRRIMEKQCDQLYPSEKSSIFASVKDNNLYGYTDIKKQLFNPAFYFNSGYLVAVDYSSDMQWNFNINNQLSGIDSTMIPVFAKSILFRDTPIQNFGNKKFINIPVENRYRLIEVPASTKNVVYVKDHLCIESKEKTGVKYIIVNNHNTQIIDLDYLAYFTIKGNFVFIPENGSIDVYEDGMLKMKMDASVCTRDSKIYSTLSGIVLLESGNLYLINTK